MRGGAVSMLISIYSIGKAWQIKQNQRMDSSKVLFYCLQRSVEAKNQEQIEEATQTMLELSQQPTYVLDLLSIANSTNADFQITVAALAQLKNHLRTNWSQRKCNITQEARKNLLGSLPDTFSNLGQNLKYSKLLIDITTIVGQGLCLQLEGGLLCSLTSPQEIRLSLMILLGISKSFRFCCEQTKLVPFYELFHANFQPIITFLNLGIMHLTTPESQTCPHHLETLNQKNNYLEIFYLAVKIGTKTVTSSLNGSLRQQMLQLSSLCFQALSGDSEVPSKKEDWAWRGDSGAFYETHGRKWALKFIGKILDNIVISKLFGVHTRWHQVWSSKQLINFSVQLLTRASCPQLKYHQLRFLEKLVSLQPEMFAVHTQPTIQLLEQILPSLIMLTDSDLTLAETEPAAFIQMETYDRRSHNYESPRRVAVQVWYGLATIGLTSLSPTHQTYLDVALQLLNRWSLSGVSQAQEVGLSLLARVALTIKKQEVLSKCDPVLNSLYELLQHQSPWIGIRVLDVVASCGSLLDTQVLCLLRDAILGQLLQSNKELQGLGAIVSIKSSLSLNQVFSRAEVCEGVDPQKIKGLLEVLLRILSQYEFEEVMCSFKHLIQHFGATLSHQAAEVVAAMQKLILWYIERDQQQLGTTTVRSNFNINYMGIAASSVSSLVSLTSLMTTGSPLQAALETTVSVVFSTVLSRPHEDYEEYLELIMPLLSSYLEKLQEPGLTPSLSFLLRALCFRIVRVPIAVRQQLSQYPPTDEQSILGMCMQGKPYGLQNYLRVFRAFCRHLMISRGSPMRSFGELRQNLLACSNLEIFMYTVESFFRRKNDPLGQQQGKVFGILQLVYVMEMHGSVLPSPILETIFKVIFSTSSRLAKNSFMTKYTLQLFCLWVFYENPDNVEDNLIRLNQSSLLILRLFQNEGRYGPREIANTVQRVRVILGLAKFLQVTLTYPRLFLRESVELLTAWLIFFLRQNLKQRGLMDHSTVSEDEYHYYFDRPQQVRAERRQKECFWEDLAKNSTDENWEGFEAPFQDNDYELDEQILGCFNSSFEEGLAEQFAIAVFLQFKREHSGLYRQAVLRQQENNLSLVEVLEAMELLEKDEFQQLVNLSFKRQDEVGR